MRAGGASASRRAPPRCRFALRVPGRARGGDQTARTSSLYVPPPGSSHSRSFAGDRPGEVLLGRGAAGPTDRGHYQLEGEQGD